MSWIAVDDSFSRVYSMRFISKLKYLCYAASLLLIFVATSISFIRFLPGENIQLYQHVRPRKQLVIFLLTSTKTLPTRGRDVSLTWGRRAKDYRELGSIVSPVDVVFSESADTSEYGISHLPVPDVSYDDLYKKTFSTFHYLYKHHLNDYEWFMKADDDTFIKIRSLLALLNNPSINASEPLLLGRKGGSWCWGGPGYILNRRMLSLMGPYLPYCKKNKRFHGEEDVMFGECMKYALSQALPDYQNPGCQAIPGGNGHEFLALGHNDVLWEHFNEPQYTFSIPYSDSSEWSFDKAIALHTVRGSMMYQLNYLYE
ncbi:hypothetical protein K493DRAFT_404109 [Basidiobolus meristosporus CBS 931.73]|uniref:N-acetylgalactosaminide beta-1,3-galactosyltransferase n=1 Tax=Basidiobolus meristosporus CBS 931.73 TaxID=1314790 RepID=A0A1Y1Z7F5_9FUNG|nr:hypothetical protein K493DRAFT_404109 [Basidiobolus meristosporus CBS 931.73]|eukprot:ORY06200.1 hypothetical protein K493DRAFT_404109 [Basidiobolus meristosporus CBS 931.73]